MNTTVLVIALFLAAVAVAGGRVLMVVRARRTNPSWLFAASEKAMVDGRWEAARRSLDDVVRLVGSDTGRSPDGGRLLGKALARLAEIDVAAGDRAGAFENYKRAGQAGASLSPEAVSLMAECYAEIADTSAEAVESYLACLGIAPASGSGPGKVLAVLQSICRVSEEMTAAERRAGVAVNLKVNAARPELPWPHYFLGLARLLDGQAAQALALFSRAGQLDPSRAMTYYWMVVCHLQQAEPDLDAAIPLVERFISFPPTGDKSYKREARACAEIGKRLVEKLGGFDTTQDCDTPPRRETLAKALRYFELATARQEDQAEYHLSLARACVLAGDATRAISHLDRALRLDPNGKLVAYHLGVQRRRSGDLSGAAAALDTAVRIDPAYGDALILLGETLLLQGDPGTAERHLRAALKAQPSHRTGLALLLRALHGQGRHEQVVREAEAAPSGFVSDNGDAEAAIAVARSYARSGGCDRAVPWLRACGKDRRGLYYLGCMYAHTGDVVAAQRCFDPLVTGSDEWAVRARVQRGHVLLGQGDLSSAERDYGHVLGLDPGNPQALRGLGSLAYQRDDLDTALSCFGQALAAEPDDSETRFNLAVTLERRGDYPGAIQHYEALQADGGCGTRAALRLGVLQARAGAAAKALKSLEECGRQGEDGDAFLFYRGTAFLMAGRGDEAIKDWRRLLDRCPRNELLRTNLVRAIYAMGARRLSAGDVAGTLAAWEEYLKLYPADDRTARDMGELHFREAVAELMREGGGDVARATREIRAAIARDGSNPHYAFVGALLSLRAGDHDRCLAGLAALIASMGRTPRLLYHQALCLLHKGEKSEAVKVFEEVKRASGAGAYGRYATWALANEVLRGGRHQDALAMLAAAPQPAMGEQR